MNHPHELLSSIYPLAASYSKTKDLELDATRPKFKNVVNSSTGRPFRQGKMWYNIGNNTIVETF